MLFSLLTYLLISNALSLRKDKSILFSRIVMVSLIFTSLFAGYLALVLHIVYNFNSNPGYYLLSFLILIYILPLLGLILFFYKLELIVILSLISLNFFFMLQAFNISFAFICLLLNNFGFLEYYYDLSNRYNPMDISNMLNPASTSSDAGGSGGGPSNSQIPVAPQQSNSGESQDNQPSATNDNLASQYNFLELGNSLENKVNNVLAERQHKVDISPFNPGGRPSRISEVVDISKLQLTKGEKNILKDLANSPNFPTNFASFRNLINGGSPGHATIYSPGYKYDLINYIKSYNQ